MITAIGKKMLVSISTAAGYRPASSEPGEHGLSEREEEVLRRIALGRSNAQIASEMFRGVSTVKTYVNRLLTKLDLRDRTQAAVWAYEHAIVRPEVEPSPPWVVEPASRRRRRW